MGTVVCAILVWPLVCEYALRGFMAVLQVAALVLRVCFTLGNVTANSDTARAACVQHKFGGTQ